MAGIVLAVTVVTPSVQAAESFDGLWAMTKKDCRNTDNGSLLSAYPIGLE